MIRKKSVRQLENPVVPDPEVLLEEAEQMFPVGIHMHLCLYVHIQGQPHRSAR